MISTSFVRGKYSSDDFVICDMEQNEWNHFLNTGIYNPFSLRKEGFIHCAKPKQLLYVMNKYFLNDDYMVMVTNKEKIGKHLVYEGKDESNLYPHIYRPLYKEDLIDFFPIKRSLDGTFHLPEVFCEIGKF